MLDRVEASPPSASPVAEPSWSVAAAPLPMSTPCDASHELSVSRPLVTSALIWPDCWSTPETTSQIEPTTTAVSPSSTSSAPAERGTPRAPIRSTRGAKRAPSTMAMTSGTTKPETCASSQSTATVNASTPTSSHERTPQRTSPGDAAADHPALRGSLTDDAPLPRRAPGSARRGAIVGLLDRPQRGAGPSPGGQTDPRGGHRRIRGTVDLRRLRARRPPRRPAAAPVGPRPGGTRRWCRAPGVRGPPHRGGAGRGRRPASRPATTGTCPTWCRAA